MSSTYLIPKEKGLSIMNAAVFIVGDVSGTGILSLARAVEDTGLAGLILIVVCVIFSAYTGILLGEAWIMASEIFEDCKGHIQNPYQLLAQKTYGKAGRYVLSISLHITVFGGAVVFLLLAADNMQTLVKTLGRDISFCYWVPILMTFLLPLTWFGTPKNFWLIAYGSTLSTISATVIIILVSVGVWAPTQPKVRHHPTDGEGFMLALGTIVFALGGHPNFLNLQVDMNRQKDFRKVIFFAFIIVSLLYLPVASVGYFVYGKSLDANILNNLPPGGLSNAVLLLVTIHLLSAFVIILNPLLQEVDMVLHVPKEFTWKRCVTRSFVLICVLFVAETIPKFGSVLSLIGGSSLTMMVFICPILFHMRMCKLKSNDSNDVRITEALQASWEEKFEPIPLWRKVLNYEIICTGIVVGVTASVSAIINIVSPDSFSVPCYVNITGTST